jgi:hypothetical protein
MISHGGAGEPGPAVNFQPMTAADMKEFRQRTQKFDHGRLDSQIRRQDRAQTTLFIG